MKIFIRIKILKFVKDDDFARMKSYSDPHKKSLGPATTLASFLITFQKTRGKRSILKKESHEQLTTELVLCRVRDKPLTECSCLFGVTTTHTHLSFMPQSSHHEDFHFTCRCDCIGRMRCICGQGCRRRYLSPRTTPGAE